MEYLVIGGILAGGYYLSNRNERKPLNAKTSLDRAPFAGPKNSPYQSRPSTDIQNDIGQPVDHKGQPMPPIGSKYHTNMYPYFGSTIKQNTDPEANTQILDYMTGAGSMDIGKRESEQLFNREERAIGTPFGAPNQVEEQREHIVVPKMRNNELPFEQIRSGPGLNDGYTNIPSGGVQQSAARDAALRRYKTVDELRPKSDPKQTYEGVVMNPVSHIKVRGVTGEHKHRHPDRFYVNKDGERNLVTMGAYTKPRVMPQPVDRAVNRPSTTREYFGVGKAADTNASYKRPAHKISMRTKSEQLPMGPATYASGGGGEYAQDHGKDGYTALPNQRTITGTRTKIGGAHGGMYAGPNQFPDEAKFTRKMYFTGNPRAFGEMQSTYPKGLPAKDPNDIARPTIREQTEDNEFVGGARPLYGVENDRQRGDYEALDTMTTREQTAEQKYVRAPKAYIENVYDRKAEKNMRQNRSKEKIAKGRTPTAQKNKIASGKESVRIRTKKIQSDYFNQYPRAPTRIKESTANRATFGAMKLKPTQGSTINVERSNSQFLHPLKSNPYVISVAGPPQ
jgi:hypothetical protein